MKKKTMAVRFRANYLAYEFGQTYSLPENEACELVALGHASLVDKELTASPAREAENVDTENLVPVDR